MNWPTHKQVWAKVNAPVDSSIVTLIEALSDFTGLETIESCQGNGKEPIVVFFRYGEYWSDPWRPLADFVLGYLAPGLAKEIGDNASIVIRLDMSGVAQAHLKVRPGAVQQTIQVIRRLRDDTPYHPRP